MDTIVADEFGRGRHGSWQTGRHNLFALRFPISQFEVQAEEETQRIFGVFHAVGGADGGVEGGLGVAEAVGAGGFEGAIEVAQGLVVNGRELAVSSPKVSKGVNSENRHLLRIFLQKRE